MKMILLEGGGGVGCDNENERGGFESEKRESEGGVTK